VNVDEINISYKQNSFLDLKSIVRLAKDILSRWNRKTGK